MQHFSDKPASFSVSEFFHKRFKKDFIIVLIGRGASAILGFIFIFLIIRNFSGAEFGILSTALAVTQITAAIASLALDNGMVRYLSNYFEGEDNKAGRMLKLAAKLRLVSGLAVAIIGYFLAPTLAQNIFEGKVELILPLRLAFAGAFALSLKRFSLAVIQSLRRFIPYMVIELVSPVGKILVIFILLYLQALSLVPLYLLAYISLALLSALLGTIFIPIRYFREKGPSKDVFWELFHFGKWVAVSYASCIIFERLDILMLTRYMPDMGEVGIYSIGFRFITPIMMLSSTMMLICTPIASRMKGNEEYKLYIKNIIKIMWPASLLCCGLFFISRPLIQMAVGKSPSEAAMAAKVFNILLIGIVFRLVTSPLTLITYAENKPKILAYADLTRLGANIIGNYLLIRGKFGFPAWGIYGAAIATTVTVFAGNAVVLGYIYFSVFRKRGCDKSL